MLIDKEKIQAHVIRHKFPYGVLTVLVLCNIPLFIDLISDWLRDDNYSHGFFMIPISVYLFWKKREDLHFPAGPSSLGIVVFLSGLLLQILGTAASEYFTTRVGLVLALSGLSLYYLGYKNFRKVWFSFFFLLFMIPIPAIIYYAATLPMQLFATKVTVFLLDFIGVPVSRSGNIIYLPDYALEVAEACSGLRSLVTLMSLGALYAYLRLPGKIIPVILFLATVPIAVTTNIFRIFTTAVGAYAVSKEIAEDFLHEISGLMVFVTALILMIIFGAILQWIRKSFISSSAQ